jgi:hypothetical protein
MALTKQQAYPLYFLLATDSQLVRDLKSTPYTDANAFLLGLQQKVTVLEPSATVDPTLTAAARSSIKVRRVYWARSQL